MARVLIGVDGSEFARRAARQATRLLGSAHDVTVVQVVRPMSPIAAAPSGGLITAAALDDSLVAASNRSMVREAEADLAATVRDLGVDATTSVVTGDPSAELCRLAAEGNFDLLVVGSHGSGFLKRVLLGSVSHDVLHHAPCPVLVVRESNDGELAERDAEEQ